MHGSRRNGQGLRRPQPAAAFLPETSGTIRHTYRGRPSAGLSTPTNAPPPRDSSSSQGCVSPLAATDRPSPILLRTVTFREGTELITKTKDGYGLRQYYIGRGRSAGPPVLISEKTTERRQRNRAGKGAWRTACNYGDE